MWEQLKLVLEKTIEEGALDPTLYVDHLVPLRLEIKDFIVNRFKRF